MKYVMFAQKAGDLELRLPVIFPNSMVHESVAIAIIRAYAIEGVMLKPVSAGDYNPFNGSVSGKSETLDLPSHPDDARVILFCDYGAGFIG